MCLYHIIKESTRRKTAVASDRLRHETQYWEKKKSKRNICGLYFSQTKGLTFSLNSIFKALWLRPFQHLRNALKASRILFVFTHPPPQSPLATTTNVLCIGEDSPPVSMPDTRISLLTSWRKLYGFYQEWWERWVGLQMKQRGQVFCRHLHYAVQCVCWVWLTKLNGPHSIPVTQFNTKERRMFLTI